MVREDWLGSIQGVAAKLQRSEEQEEAEEDRSEPHLNHPRDKVVRSVLVLAL